MNERVPLSATGPKLGTARRINRNEAPQMEASMNSCSSCLEFKREISRVMVQGSVVQVWFPVQSAC